MIRLTPGAVRMHCKHCKKDSWFHYRPAFEGVHNGKWSRVKSRWVCKGERSAGLRWTVLIPESGCSRSQDMQSADAYDKFMREWFRTCEGMH
jgi:hypothetical protein